MRTLRATSVAVAAGAALVLLTWMAPAVVADAASATAPGGRLDDLVGAAALGLGWVIAAWLSLGAAVTAGACAPGVVGRAFAALSRAVAPAVVRRAVLVTVGLTVAGPVAAASALPGLPASSGEPGYPVLDRVVVQPAPAAVEPSTSPSAPPVEVRPEVAPAVPSDPAPPTSTVEVRPGDSLWGIAASALGPDPSARDVAAAWPRWYDANRDVIGADPGLILPGQLLETPR